MVDYKGKVGGGVASTSFPHGSGVVAEPSNMTDLAVAAVVAEVQDCISDGVLVDRHTAVARLGVMLGRNVAAKIVSEVGSIITFKDVEQGLVGVMELWRRTPSAGRGSPFASDGPWELADRDLYGPDVDKDVPLRPAPLSRAEVAERDRVTAWVELAPERDRRLVSLAIVQMSRRGYKSPGFKQLLPQMGLRLGADGLRKRYNRAIYKIAAELNLQAEARRAADERR